MERIAACLVIKIRKRKSEKKNVLWGNVKKRTAAIRSQGTLFDCLKYVATVLAFDLKS